MSLDLPPPSFVEFPDRLIPMGADHLDLTFHLPYTHHVAASARQQGVIRLSYKNATFTAGLVRRPNGLSAGHGQDVAVTAVDGDSDMMISFNNLNDPASAEKLLWAPRQAQLDHTVGLDGVTHVEAIDTHHLEDQHGARPLLQKPYKCLLVYQIRLLSLDKNPPHLELGVFVRKNDTFQHHDRLVWDWHDLAVPLHAAPAAQAVKQKGPLPFQTWI